MNPHFIFNALNSINAFVQRNDQDSASSYLSKFARVMRLVLENSRHAEVPLTDDLEALRGYMDLERMRMNKKFDFTIILDPSIDPEEVLVPPLVGILVIAKSQLDLAAQTSRERGHEVHEP